MNMNHMLMLTLVATLSFVQGQVAAQTDEAEAEIVLTLERIADSFESGELGLLDEVFAPGPGVHIIEGAGVNHGWAEYRDEHLRPELEAFKNLVYRYFAIEPVVRGELAFAAFRYELSADLNGGPLNMEGRGTAVLEQLEGRWKIVHLHTSGRRNQ
ncbi:MAG: nuclear transport factor 2 family protein [Gammaproteobacteria bacterium]